MDGKVRFFWRTHTHTRGQHGSRVDGVPSKPIRLAWSEVCDFAIPWKRDKAVPLLSPAANVTACIENNLKPGAPFTQTAAKLHP